MTKRPFTIISILLLLLLGITFGYLLGVRHDTPPCTPGAVTERIEHEQLFTCPMHPDFIQEGPGSCPICGMDLVSKDEEVKQVDGLVAIDPVTVQNIGVRTEVVQKRSLSRVIRTVGRVTYDERKIFHIHTKFSGWIEKLHVNFTGQSVRHNQPLISIYSPELVATQKEYLQAYDYHQSMETSGFDDVRARSASLLVATRRRLELWDITEAQIKRLEETREIKRSMVIYAPSNGIVVTMEAAREGMYVDPGMNLYTIADISQVWVEADIYEYELPWIQVGQTATMILSYYPGKEYEGAITFIYPFLEAKTRTLKIRLEFENSDLELKPDMYANVLISSDITKDGVAVPIQAVIYSGKRNIIIIDRGEGLFEPREVTIGVEAEGYYHILKGVKEGEKVVTSAQFLIDSESNMRAAISSMKEPGEEIEEFDPDLDMRDMTMEDIGM